MKVIEFSENCCFCADFWNFENEMRIPNLCRESFFYSTSHAQPQYETYNFLPKKNQDCIQKHLNLSIFWQNFIFCEWKANSVADPNGDNCTFRDFRVRHLLFILLPSIKCSTSFDSRTTWNIHWRKQNELEMPGSSVHSPI